MGKTLKNVALIAVLGVVLLTLTGCANINYDIKLNKDGSGEVSYVMGYDKSFLKSVGVNTSDLDKDNSFTQMQEDATNEGYAVENYEDDNTYGFKASKHVNNIQEDFNLNDEAVEGEESKIMFEKTLLKTKFSQNSKLDLTNMGQTQDVAMMKALLSQMKVSYKIALPFKVTSSNATTVSDDGKTLEWTLKAGEINEISFEATQDYTIYALGGLAVILLIIVTAIIVSSKKSKKTVEVKPVEIKKEEKETKEVKTEEVVKDEKVEEDNKDEETPAKEEKSEVVEENTAEEKVEEDVAQVEEEIKEEAEHEEKTETVEEPATEEKEEDVTQVEETKEETDEVKPEEENNNKEE